MYTAYHILEYFWEISHVMVIHGANMFAPSFSFDVEIDHVVKVEGPHKGFLLLVDEGFVEGMHGWVSVLEIEV